MDANTGTYAAVLSAGPNGTALTANTGATNGLNWFQTVAPGIVAATAASSAPAGWVLCDGSTYARGSTPYTDPYNNLFTALGGGSSPWGLPSGSTFKVPDLRGRTIIGVGTGAGLTARALAGLYGQETYTLLAANLANHNHAFTVNSTNTSGESGHTHGAIDGVYGYISGFVGTGPFCVLNNSSVPSAYVSYTYNTGSSTGHVHSFSYSGTTGNYPGTGATAFGILQPSAGLNYIVKL